jgi:ABC-2 type transport system ATP-binding protein
MTANLIQAQGVTKTFGKTKALDGVDLRVAQGSVLALLGPNGAGKTTMLSILTTLLQPDGGTVRVAGYDALREPDKVRASIGVAGQSVTVDGLLSGLQNLTMIGRLYRLSPKDSKRRGIELIERFGLGDAANRPVKTYSGGMRRRLDLAASLILQPPVLFLDEPTTGLDPESRNAAWEVIRQLVRDGTTLLLTTQYLEEADQLADDIAVIDQGRIIASDTPGTLKNKLGGERLDVTLAHGNDIKKLTALAGKALPITRPGTLSFALAKNERGLTEVSAILQQLVAEKVEVKDYNIHRPTLEEAFLQLINNKTNASEVKERSHV